MYDPTVGRFINLDPIGFTAGDTNTNRYVGNRVTIATDPTGLRRRPMTDGSLGRRASWM